jgi:outer membrane protein OmpA-like peptidoglycan-associated protein
MNLLSVIQSQLSPQTVGQISNTIGESPEGTKAALGAAFPALLGCLVGKASASPSGTTDLFNMIKQGQSSGAWSDSISKIVGGAGSAPAQSAGNSLVNSLLGSKAGPVTEFIASRCGIHAGSATSLLGIGAPFLMGIIGKHVASQGLGPAGLGQFLGSQTQYLKDAMPAGLANTLGIGNVLSATDETPVTPSIPSPSYSRSAEPVRPGPGEPARAPARSGNALKWVWVPLVIAIAAWLLARSQRNHQMGGTGQPVTTESSAGHGAQTADFARLNLPPGSVADRIAKAISAGNWNQPVNLNGVSFDTTGGVTDADKGQLQQIASVLAAAPNVRVQITGHGGSEEAALNQANSIKNALTAAHVPDNRISTRGQTGTEPPSLSLSQ